MYIVGLSILWWHCNIQGVSKTDRLLSSLKSGFPSMYGLSYGCIVYKCHGDSSGRFGGIADRDNIIANSCVKWWSFQHFSENTIFIKKISLYFFIKFKKWVIIDSPILWMYCMKTSSYLLDKCSSIYIKDNLTVNSYHVLHTNQSQRGIGITCYTLPNHNTANSYV